MAIGTIKAFRTSPSWEWWTVSILDFCWEMTPFGIWKTVLEGDTCAWSHSDTGELSFSQCPFGQGLNALCLCEV